ncbi:MAG: hypothetical protein C4539_08465 [Ignavibacteriales bacterium]|nr:MAG: hypothetical protein C4539_08465 [Ignavibacteriales bacterium]
MKKIFYTVLICSSFLFAQNAGETGLSFLKFGFGARNISMGNIGVVTANDVTALNYNPALLSEFTSSEILFMHNEWIQDVRSEYLGASIKIFGLPFAFNANTTSVSDIQVRKIAGEPETTFNANYFTMGLSTGFSVYEDVSIGFGVKYLYEGMFSDDATGWGMDLGGYYKSPIENLTFGIAVRNIGKMHQLKNEATELPTDLSIGAGYSLQSETLKSVFNLGLEYQKYFNDETNHINFGGEMLFDNLIALRIGYRYQNVDASRLFSTGLGLHWGNLNFDYAYSPFRYNLGNAHSISLKFKF